MDASKRRILQFLQKEIKTYTSLALFLSKKRIKQRVRGSKELLISPAFYKHRIEEATDLVNELRRAN